MSGGRILEFLLTRLMRGVTTASSPITSSTVLFLLTRLMRGVTAATQARQWFLQISTHTPHARRDCIIAQACMEKWEFLLTRLMRGVTRRSFLKSTIILFLLTRLMRGVTFAVNLHPFLRQISTHTPHARRDPWSACHRYHQPYFYSHASCEA